MLKLAPATSGGDDGFKLWQSLVRQTELTAQLCSIMRDARNIRVELRRRLRSLGSSFQGFLVSSPTLMRLELCWGCFSSPIATCFCSLELDCAVVSRCSVRRRMSWLVNLLWRNELWSGSFMWKRK